MRLNIIFFFVKFDQYGNDEDRDWRKGPKKENSGNTAGDPQSCRDPQLFCVLCRLSPKNYPLTHNLAWFSKALPMISSYASLWVLYLRFALMGWTAGGDAQRSPCPRNYTVRRAKVKIRFSTLDTCATSIILHSPICSSYRHTYIFSSFPFRRGTRLFKLLHKLYLN